MPATGFGVIVCVLEPPQVGSVAWGCWGAGQDSAHHQNASLGGVSSAPGALQTGLSGSFLRPQSDKLDVCVLWQPVLWGSEEWGFS